MLPLSQLFLSKWWHSWEQWDMRGSLRGSFGKAFLSYKKAWERTFPNWPSPFSCFEHRAWSFCRKSHKHQVANMKWKVSAPKLIEQKIKMIWVTDNMLKPLDQPLEYASSDFLRPNKCSYGLNHCCSNMLYLKAKEFLNDTRVLFLLWGSLLQLSLLGVFCLVLFFIQHNISTTVWKIQNSDSPNIPKLEATQIVINKWIRNCSISVQ